MAKDGIEIAVSTIGEEGLRIVSLILGFAIVQLVLLLAAYRSRRQNINQLISFVLILAGGVGLMTLVLSPFLNQMSGFGSEFIFSIIAILVVVMLTVGIMMHKQMLRVPFAKVAISGSDPENEKDKLKKLQSISTVQFTSKEWDVKQLYKGGTRWFVGFGDDVSIERNLRFISDSQDAMFFSTGSAKDGMVIPSNMFRLMTSNDRQQAAIECHVRTKVVRVVGLGGSETATIVKYSKLDALLRERGAEGNVNLFVAMDPEEFKEFVEFSKSLENTNVISSVWVSQNCMHSTPSRSVWNYMLKNEVRMCMTNSFSIAPFRNTHDVFVNEAQNIIYEVVLGTKEDLRTTVDIIKFIHSMQKLSTRGETDQDTNLLIVEPTKSHEWVFKSNFTLLCDVTK